MCHRSGTTQGRVATGVEACDAHDTDIRTDVDGTNVETTVVGESDRARAAYQSRDRIGAGREGVGTACTQQCQPSGCDLLRLCDGSGGVEYRVAARGQAHGIHRTHRKIAVLGKLYRASVACQRVDRVCAECQIVATA